ncbi:hypothetical protein EDD11_000873 [Mortierella claussenii]|nr:hypothetical protein EDD11_000873 [Mortierella claussenii]
MATFSLLSPRLLLLLLACSAAYAQNSSNYQPIAYAASAILSDGGLYLYGGVTKFAPDNVRNTGSKQFLRLDLTQSFNTTAPPWTTLDAILTFTMITAVPSLNGKQFIIGGNRDNIGPLAYIYDIASATWDTTPNLPGMTSMSSYKRGNVGMSLDYATGMVYIYGGYGNFAFLNELSVLDSTKSDPKQMNWTLSYNQTTIPPLYMPMVTFLPTLNKTLVMGGCPTIDNVQGVVANCAPLTLAYLIASGDNYSTVSIRPQALSTGPATRFQACRVVLEDGNVFVQGGRDINQMYGDAWILNINNWTWTPIEITGSQQAMTRAGHACEMGPNGQIIVVGGMFKVGENYTFVEPSMAVIDTHTWTWGTSYKGSALVKIWPSVRFPDRGSGTINNGTVGELPGELSAGAKAGVGIAVAFGVLGLLVGLFLYRKSKARTRESPSNLHENHTTGRHFSQHEKNESLNDDNGGQGTAPTATATAGSLMYDGGNHQNNLHRGDLNNNLSHSNGPSWISPSRAETAPAPGVPVAAPYNTAVSPPIINHASRPANHGRPAFFSGLSSTSTDHASLNDAALAAALFQAEDQLASRRSPTSMPSMPSAVSLSYTDRASPLSQHLSLSQPSSSNNSQEVYSTTSSTSPFAARHTESNTAYPLQSHPNTSQSLSSPSFSPAISAKHSSDQTSLDSSTLSRVPTIHTPVIGTIISANPDGSSWPRSAPGPQSVPEQEAWIERSSPGVKAHAISSRDLDPNGLYPPLSPTRVHGSILVGTPASHIASTANSFAAAATSSLKFSPLSDSNGAGAGNSEVGRGRGGEPGSYFEHSRAVEDPAQDNDTASMTRSNNYATASKGNHPITGLSFSSSPQCSSYRDPQMMKDLDDIARMIESQALAETKNPHAIVATSPLTQMNEIWSKDC